MYMSVCTSSTCAGVSGFHSCFLDGSETSQCGNSTSRSVENTSACKMQGP